MSQYDHLPAASAKHARHAVPILLIGLLLAGGVCIKRTAMKPYYRPFDWALYYTASRAWLDGQDPYNRRLAFEHWIDAGGRPDIELDSDTPAQGETWGAIIQLPSAFSAMAPLAIFPARAATWLWYVLLLSLLVAQTAVLTRMAGSRTTLQMGIALLAITLLLAPVHESIGYGQPSAVAISLIILGLGAAFSGENAIGGVLMGLATAVKPQLGIGFFIYYLLIGNWRFVAALSTTFLLLTAAAIVRMGFSGVAWFAGWQENFQYAQATGGMNDPSILNPQRSYLLNLHLILHAAFTSRWLVDGLALLLVAALSAVFARRRRRAREQRQPQDQLLDLSVVSILTLLPVYHRFYDAGLLVVPLVWSLRHLHTQPRWAWPAFLVPVSFIVPIAATTRFARLIGESPFELHTWWWNGFVEPFRTWILLAGCAILIGAVGARTASRDAVEAPPAIDELALARRIRMQQPVK
jgi:hypothetical protein